MPSFTGVMPAFVRASRARATVVVLSLLLAACEGLLTGSEVMRQPLEPRPDGGFAPVRIALTPEMSPVAVNMHGRTAALAHEGGKWDTFTATLRLDGNVVASGTFNVNNRGSSQEPEATSFAQTMIQLTVTQAGEYELSIAPTRAREITLEELAVAVRRNVQPLTK